MVNSYYPVQTADVFVTVWPAVTGERHFYDVSYGPIVRDHDDDYATLKASTRVDRVTAFEAAAIVITETGLPYGETNNSIARRIADWRAEYEASGVNYEGAQ